MGQRDVASIALVQTYGLLAEPGEAEPVEIKAFADNGDDADLNWVKDIVRSAHGNEPLVYAYNATVVVAADDTPNMKEIEQLHFHISSEGGPTWGMVIRL